MIVYTVHEPRNPPADRLDRAAELRFVRDGFSLLATLLGPVWMLVHGLWLVLIGYLVMVTAIVAVGIAGLGAGWALVLVVALNVIVGFEWPSLRRWTLERRGWRSVGTVTGRNAAECERRFFESWLPGEPFLDSARLMAPAEGLSAAAGSLGAYAPGPRSLGERLAGDRAVVERGSPRLGWRSIGWRRSD
jgi:hypothetical protein